NAKTAVGNLVLTRRSGEVIGSEKGRVVLEERLGQKAALSCHSWGELIRLSYSRSYNGHTLTLERRSFWQSKGKSDEEIYGAVYGFWASVRKDDERLHSRAAEERDGRLDELDDCQSGIHCRGRSALGEDQAR